MKSRSKARPRSSRSVAVRTRKPRSRFILNCLKSRDMENDWPIDAASESGILTAGSIPSSKDLRESWWRIGNQGSTGSCVGWAAADSVLRWHFVMADRLSKKEKLSVRFIWMASKETDVFVSRPTTFIESDGTSLKAALDIARKFGNVRDATLPFGSGGLYQGETSSFYAMAAQRKISSYFNLKRNLDAWRRWLAYNGPILTRLDVDATWENATATKGRLKTFKKETASDGHAVALVGYTSKHFIVRNSWGKGWGDKGFAYASDAYAADAFTEAYGVAL